MHWSPEGQGCVVQSAVQFSWAKLSNWQSERFSPSQTLTGSARLHG